MTTTGWLGLVLLALATICVVLVRRYWRHLFVRYQEWAIAMYSGPTPLDLSPVEGLECPVLTAHQVSDVQAVFVADPFLVRSGGMWFMFFEIMPVDGKGIIGLASSPDGKRWQYERVVLEESFHLSYPHVFCDGGTYYMTPETLGAGAVVLYRATVFPGEWERCGTLLDVPRTDPTIFRHGDLWWMFAGIDSDTLELYWADDVAGPWRRHPDSPVVVGDPHNARPAGRVVEYDGRLVRLAQDDAPRYGLKVHAFEVSALSPEVYAETEYAGNPVLAAAPSGWNARGMHHCDAQQLESSTWLAAVDGQQLSVAVRLPVVHLAWRSLRERNPRALDDYARSP